MKDPKAAKKRKEEEEEQLSEQRKLVFGMLFSLRELSSSLSPEDGPGDLQLVKTGASTLYNYETVSGLRFVLYTTTDTTSKNNNKQSGGGGSSNNTPQSSLHGNTSSVVSNAPILTAPTTTGLINSATTSMTTNDSSSSGYGINNNSLHGGSGITNPTVTSDIRKSLKYIYETIWITAVIRSPMYRPNSKDNCKSIKETNFEAVLDAYFKQKSWFR